MGTNHTLRSEGFQKQLAFGQLAETDIAKWIMRRGGTVLPIYDIEYDTGKGPRVFSKLRTFVAPDMLVFKAGRMCWIEAKHKSVFAWYRLRQIWTTGIDLHHYSQYHEVQELLGIPVWLLFLHRSSTPSAIDRKHESCPATCPTGLFGGNLEFLSRNEDHRSDRHGSSGMVYWAHATLTKMASVGDMMSHERPRP